MSVETGQEYKQPVRITDASGREAEVNDLGELKVAAAIFTATGAQEVLITDADDSVKIGDGDGNYVAVTSGAFHTREDGYSGSEFARNDYTGTSVTTSAYVELIASTAKAYEEFEIFDSSGQTLVIAFGAAGFEVDKFLVLPGGNGRIKRSVASAIRISVKAVSGTASTGELSLNLYG